MGLTVGKVVGQSVGTYKSIENVRQLQVELFDDSPETIIAINAGKDFAPVNGDLVIVKEIGSDKYVFAIKDPFEPVAIAGEKELYSYDDTDKKARLKLKLDGSLGLKNEVESLDYSTVFTAYNTAIKAIITSDAATISAGSQTALDNALVNVLKVISGV